MPSAAVVIVLLGIVPLDAAGHRLREIGPTVGFLAAILVFGHLCAEAGVFDYLGGLAARSSRGDPRRLLVLVVALAAASPRRSPSTRRSSCSRRSCSPPRRGWASRPRPHAYACARLANSGSLLLPVSNLTNLLAFTAAGCPSAGSPP